MEEFVNPRIHQSLLRPRLILGVEQRIFFAIAFLAGFLAFFATFWYIVIAIVVWISGMAVARSLAKIDPQMRAIFMESLDYSGYYPSRSTSLKPRVIKIKSEQTVHAQ